ncbi:MAG: hypothetical protein H7829_05595, partial [Magnetococcus sp. THC-1_WYH]
MRESFLQRDDHEYHIFHIESFENWASTRAIAFEIGTSKCLGKNKLLKEKRGLGDCPQGFDFDFSFHAPFLKKHFFARFLFLRRKHNAMLKVLKHGIMRGIFRRRREKY